MQTAAAAHLPSELDSAGYADSAGSSPRSTTLSRGSEAEYNQRWAEDGQPRVRFMCSFGGQIFPRPHDSQLRYVGGETRIVAVGRNAGFAGLMAKLSKIAGDDLTVKYQLPNEDLDALISVTTDEDVENMMEEYDRLSVSGGRAARLRLFLFPASSTGLSDGLGAFLDGSKRGDWFLDALNGGSSRGVPAPELERRRSEASSVVSEVPDYLFGFDHPEAMDRDDSVQRPPAAPKSKLRPIAGDQASASESGSPAPPATPQHISTPTSAMSVPPIPDLPPLKIKPDGEPPAVAPASAPEQPNPAPEGFPNLIFSRQEQVWPYLPESHYPGNPPVAPMPVYYIPAGAVPFSYAQQMVPTSAIPPESLPLPTVLLPRASHSQGQVYRTMAPETRPAGEAFDYPTGMLQEGAVPQHLYYAHRMPGSFPAYPRGIPAASDGQLGGNAADMFGRVTQTQQK